MCLTTSLRESKQSDTRRRWRRGKEGRRWKADWWRLMEPKREREVREDSAKREGGRAYDSRVPVWEGEGGQLSEAGEELEGGEGQRL